MDIKAGEEHVRSEARDWRERALKAQAEIKRLRAALRRIANNIDECDGLHMKEIARGALKHE